MPYKKKQAIPGSVQFNKLTAALPERERRLKLKLNLEIILQNHRKELVIRANSVGYRGLKNQWFRRQRKNNNERITK